MEDLLLFDLELIFRECEEATREEFEEFTREVDLLLGSKGSDCFYYDDEEII